jgi:SAM-dependent methyltransferase
MTSKIEWQGQVGNSWAAQWQRTDRSFADLTQQLVKTILSQGLARNIADIGCGAGELSLRLAKATPLAHVLGLDISTELIATAQSRAADIPHLVFTCADAATWRSPEFIPDLYVSRHGVMFFDDPVAAFANLAQAAAPGAGLVFSCFRGAAENAWAREIGALLPTPPASTVSARAPGPFAFADADYVHSILTQAGWTDVHFEPVDFDYIAGSGEDPVSDALDFFHHIGPAARTIKMLDGAERADFIQRLKSLAEQHLHDGTVRFAAAAWIVRAHKAS